MIDKIRRRPVQSLCAAVTLLLTLAHAIAGNEVWAFLCFLMFMQAAHEIEHHT